MVLTSAQTPVQCQPRLPPEILHCVQLAGEQVLYDEQTKQKAIGVELRISKLTRLSSSMHELFFSLPQR